MHSAESEQYEVVNNCEMKLCHIRLMVSVKIKFKVLPSSSPYCSLCKGSCMYKVGQFVTVFSSSITLYKLWTTLFSLIKKSVPSASCCHHYVLTFKWYVQRNLQ